MKPTTSIQRPTSATNLWVGFAGLAAFLACVLHFSLYPVAPYIFGMIVVAVPAFVMLVIDMVIFKSGQRKTTGLDWSRFRFDLPRIMIKLCGVALTYGLIAGAYHIFPEYHGTFYMALWQAAGILLPGLFMVAVFYIVVIDSVMQNPKDGYYNFGLVALLQFHRVDRTLILPHIRSWIIKGFFIPLMFVYLTNNLSDFPNQVMDSNWQNNFLVLFGLMTALLYSIDLAFALMGYTLGLRALDTHERSNEPTALGWVVAVMCYQPFWSIFDNNYFVYEDDTNWKIFFDSSDVMLVVWGSGILVLTAIYAWSTAIFGLRFSNLTHRGIITNGPYSLTKHPAYVSKNLSWWMISLPFISTAGVGQAIAHTILLAMIGGIYFARAWTEERHLMADPTYREYQAWMAKRGIFRWVPIPWPQKSVKDL